MTIIEDNIDAYEKIKFALYQTIRSPQQLKCLLKCCENFVKSSRRLAQIKTTQDLVNILERLNIINITNIENLFVITGNLQNEGLKLMLNAYKKRLTTSNCYGKQWNKENLFGNYTLVALHITVMTIIYILYYLK